MPQNLKLKKSQGLFKDLHRNLRTFQDCVTPVRGIYLPTEM